MIRYTIYQAWCIADVAFIVMASRWRSFQRSDASISTKENRPCISSMSILWVGEDTVLGHNILNSVPQISQNWSYGCYRLKKCKYMFEKNVLKFELSSFWFIKATTLFYSNFSFWMVYDSFSKTLTFLLIKCFIYLFKLLIN